MQYQDFRDIVLEKLNLHLGECTGETLLTIEQEYEALIQRIEAIGNIQENTKKGVFRKFKTTIIDNRSGL